MVLGTNTNSHPKNVQIEKALNMLKKYLTNEGKKQFSIQFKKNANAIVEEYNSLVDTYNDKKTDKERKKMIDEKKEELKELSKEGPDKENVLKFKEMIEELSKKQSSPDTPRPDTNNQKGGNIGQVAVIAGALFVVVVTLGAGLAALSRMTPEQAAELGENIASFNDGWDAARLGGSKHKKRKGRKTKKSMKHKKGKKSKKARKTMKKKKSNKKKKSMKKRR